MSKKRKKNDSLEQIIMAILVLSIFWLLSSFIPKEVENNKGLTTRPQLSFSMEDLPEFDENTPYVVINENIPEFEEKYFTTQSFENYSELDELGRCGVAFANVGMDIMPTEERGEIGSVKPTRVAYS